MKKGLILILFLTTLIPVAFNCSGDKSDDPTIRAANFLPDSIPATGLVTTGQPRIYKGNALWEYIPGGAELYQSYNFIELASKEYARDTFHLVADIYRFATPTDAYGIYSIRRPENPTLVTLGVEGYSTPMKLTFVKGVYLVDLMGYNASEMTTDALAQVARAINDTLPGATSRPNPFLLFPVPNRIGLTDKYYAADFLGHKFLPKVYALDFYLEPDTATLFLTTDESGEKFLRWSEYAKAIGSFEPVPDSIPYDSGLSFVIYDDFYGRAAVGLRQGKLIGMVGYSPEHADFLASWVGSFQ